MTTLKTAPGTQALLDLENRAPDVLFATVAGSSVPLWPQVRNQFSLALNELDYGFAKVEAPATTRVRVGVARSLLPSRTDAMFARGHAPLCFLVGGTTVHSVDGKQRNWLIGDFADANARGSAVLQWNSGGRGRESFSFCPTWTLDGIARRAALWTRLPHSDPRPAGTRLVREFGRLIDGPLRDDQVEAIANAAGYRQALGPYVQHGVERVLDRLTPEIVVMQNASYGGWARLICAMKDRAIRVIEPQHGWIGPTHAAYNFGAAMAEPPLRRTLPEELLTFGEYWGRGLRFPGRITPIGKPHMEQAVARERVPLDRRADILVVSSTTDAEQTGRLVLSLRERLDSRWTVVFRPHPSERKVISERYAKLLAIEGVRVDTGGDVYDSLRTAAAVIGVASTVLFEALAFGCHVFVLDSPMAPYYVGDVFGKTLRSEADVAQISRRINAGELATEPSGVSSDEMWAPRAVERFQEWLRVSR